MTTIFTRDEIAKLVSIGHVLVMLKAGDVDLEIINVTNFLSFHPGFALPVLHFAGRDATDEINAYHPTAALKKMRAFKVGTLDKADFKNAVYKPILPPLHVKTGWPTDALSFKTQVPTLASSLVELRSNQGKVPESWTQRELYVDPQTLEPASPTVDLTTQQNITQSFRELKAELDATGVLEQGQSGVFNTEFIRVGGLFAAFLTSFFLACNWWSTMLSAVLLGVFWHQAMFLAHDSGHTEITGNQTKDKLFGSFLASFMMGMSLGWWSDQHNTHHLVPNHPEHDPDIQLLPFFAFSEKAINGIYSTYHRAFIPGSTTTLAMVSVQKFYFYFVMLFARFSLLGKSYHYLATKAPSGWYKNYEISGVVVFWTWFSLLLSTLDGGSFWRSWALRVVFVLTSLAITSPIHVQIVLSHSAQSSEDVGPYECFAARQLRTTMDVACPPWLDWVHGGLHQQIAHHLFPRCPRPLLRFVSAKVQAWADRTEGVTFESRGFVSSNFKIRNMLSDVAAQAKVLRAVAIQIQDGSIHMD